MESLPKMTEMSPGSEVSRSSSGSNSSSTGEEERLKRLFNSCDGDGDGYLDREDFRFMCKQLNMEELADEIMQQLGLKEQSRITFTDFIRYKTQVLAEEFDQSLGIEDQGIDSDTSGVNKQQNNMTSWPTMSSDSFGAHSGRPDSVDYDSGARDMSPEPISLQQLMDSHDPEVLRQACEDTVTSDMLELANRLHLAALTSLKGEIIEQNNRLKHVTSERDVLEKQLNRAQTDKLRLQREFEDRLEQITVRYEERVTELHSVIAELRKKIERHQINVIREEEEYEEDVAAQSTKSNDGGSHHANDSQANSLDILGNDLNSEISRVVTELESAIDERKKTNGQVVDEACNTDNVPEQADDSDSVEEKALEACKQVEVFEFEKCVTPPLPPPRGLRPATFHPPPPPPPNEFPEPAYLQEEINSLRQDCGVLHETVQKQEAELNLHKAAVGSLREERDRLRKKVQELHGLLQHYDIQLSSPQHSRTATPTKAPTQGHIADNRSQSSNEAFPVAKVAELKKLKTCANERPVLGSEITSSNQLPNTKVAEHLVQGLQECSNMQEIVQTIYTSGSQMTDSKVQEFEIEFERLQSKIDNLKSQNDLLALTLEESKSQSDRLSVLIGKYESNNTALQLAVNYSDQAIEAYDVLQALIESELGLVLANSRVLGVSGGHRNVAQNQEEIAQFTQRSRNSRKIAENVAKHLLQKLDRNYMSTASNPWEELSSTNRTVSSHGSSSGCSSEDFNKADEQRLREFIQQVKSDRAAVKSTVMELESLHLDTPSMDSGRGSEGPRIDLENAVLMQELMAMKEEKTELKAQNYILEKEKRAIELRLSGKESQEQAYMIQIEHLKAEVAEKDMLIHKDPSIAQSPDDFSTTFSIGDVKPHDSFDITVELSNALKREKKLKARVQELVIALEKLSRNSEIRHQQSAEFVNDLKRANSALIAAFDKAKKKYQGKLKKLEVQIQSLTERYEGQIHMLKQRLFSAECDTDPNVQKALSETAI